MEADKEKLGVGDFTVRMVCSLAKRSSARNGVVISSPSWGTLEQKRKYCRHPNMRKQQPAGHKDERRYFPVIPATTENWQCPIVPVILPGTPFECHPYTPGAEDLRRAVAAVVMGRTPQSECGKSPPTGL
jgi:hypothetical protein